MFLNVGLLLLIAWLLDRRISHLAGTPYQDHRPAHRCYWIAHFWSMCRSAVTS